MWPVMGLVSSPPPVSAKFYLLQFIVVYKPSSFIHTFYFLRSFYWQTRCGIKSRANSCSTHVYTLSYENNHVPKYFRTITSTLYYGMRYLAYQKVAGERIVSSGHWQWSFLAMPTRRFSAVGFVTTLTWHTFICAPAGQNKLIREAFVGNFPDSMTTTFVGWKARFLLFVERSHPPRHCDAWCQHFPVMMR